MLSLETAAGVEEYAGGGTAVGTCSTPHMSSLLLVNLSLGSV